MLRRAGGLRIVYEAEGEERGEEDSDDEEEEGGKSGIKMRRSNSVSREGKE